MSILLGLYILVLFVIAYFFRKSKSADEFLIGSRNLGWLAMTASIFTLIGGGELATMATFGHQYGWKAIFLFVGYSLGFLFLGVLSKKIKSHDEAVASHSLPDYFYAKYGFIPGLLTTVVSFLAFLALLVVQFSAGGAIVSSLTNLSYPLAVLLCGSVVAIYLALGGFKGVVATDVIQGLVMLVLLPVIYFSTTSFDFESTQAVRSELSWMAILSLVIAGYFTAIASADVWQRIYASKNARAASKGLIVAAVLFIVFGFGLIHIGEFSRLIDPTADPNNAFIHGLQALLPGGFSVFVILLVISAILSTADTEVFLLTSMASKELARWKGKMYGNHEVLQTMTKTKSQFLLIIITSIALLLSILFSDLTTIYLYLLGLIMTISPILLMGFFIDLNKLNVTLSIATNLFMFTVLIACGFLNPDNLVLIVIPGFLIVLIIKMYNKWIIKN